MNCIKNKKVIVAMSGGVDSSVTAFLLKEQGYQVIGATLDFGFGNAVIQAAKACDDLGLEHRIIDASQDMIDKVIKPFANSYLQGRTPNPCVDCNATVKFPSFLPLFSELDADYIATGHYVRLEQINERYILKRAVALEKDQSYFMYRIPQDILAKCIFPLGEFSKQEVREIATKNNLSSATQKDSFDICFIDDGDYRKCIKIYDNGNNKPGNFVDKQGNVLGRHKGLANYTVGQRRGLNLALGYPAYVIEIDQKSNQVIIGKREDLLSNKAFVCDTIFIPFDSITEDITALVQIRYAAKPVAATIQRNSDKENCLNIKFSEPVWAITPGQSAVFYNDDLVVGGGYII